jgi:hypothetical protein
MQIKHVRYGHLRYHADATSDKLLSVCKCYAYPLAEQTMMIASRPLIADVVYRMSLLDLILEAFKGIKRS